MKFVKSINTALHGLLGCFYQKDCKVCDGAPFGYHVDVTEYKSCDDCLRRQLVLGSMTRKALFNVLQKVDNETLKVVENICEQFKLSLSEEHSRALREKNLFSDYLFPVGAFSDGSNSDLKIRLSDVKTPEWKLASEDGKFAVEGEAIFALYKQSLVTLNYEVFCEICNDLTENNYQLLISLGGGIFLDEIDTNVQRWVPIANAPCGESSALGLSSVIETSIIPEKTKEGNVEDISYLKFLASAVVDSGVGITRSTHIKEYILKEILLDSPMMYYNLFYTLWLHCGPSKMKLTWVRRECQIHSLGYLAKKVDDPQPEEKGSITRQNWVPEEYGKKVPEKIINQVSPYITGVTSSLLALGRLPKSLVNYLTSKAKIIAPAFGTLSAQVQAFLTAKYKEVSSIPEDIIRRVTGKSVEEASSIIFTKSKMDMSSFDRKNRKETKKEKKSTGSISKKIKQPRKQGDATSYKGFTKKQQHKLFDSFGGDFKRFLVLKRKFKLEGNLDLLKLSEYFDNGEKSFGRNRPADISKKCRKN